IGVNFIRRTEVRPFSDKQIALLKTFADQGVIAIENARLIREQQTHNRELTEALEQQTATGEVLRVIASSPTDIQPVLDTVIASAVKLASATKGYIRQFDGKFHRVVAHYGESEDRVSFLRANPLSADPDTLISRAFLQRRPIHIHDVQLETGEVLALARQTGSRTLLVVPLLREGTPIGGITIWRDFVEPFTERQIELVKTFADQAVIAIENVRLFQELKESLDQQTATSEILGVIASSPTDLQPVMDVVVERSARLCDASDSLIMSVVGENFHRVAQYGRLPAPALGVPIRISRGLPGGLAVLERRTIHVDDIAAEIETKYPDARSLQQEASSRTL